MREKPLSFEVFKNPITLKKRNVTTSLQAYINSCMPIYISLQFSPHYIVNSLHEEYSDGNLKFFLKLLREPAVPLARQ